MNIRFKCINSKKGSYALESLLGVILSVTVLIYLYKIFASVFLAVPDNLLIAQENANSIVEFVNYFQENPEYSNLDNCFNILNIDYLENFQFYTKDYNDNYFLVIDNLGVYILPYIHKEKFLDDNNYKKYSKYFISFEENKGKNINLFYDNTDKLDLDILVGLISFGLSTDEIKVDLVNFKDDNKEFYVLYPKLASNVDKALAQFIPFKDKISNNYDVNVLDGDGIFGKDLDGISKGDYLVYSNNYNKFGQNIFFSINSKYTLPQVRNNLCFKKYYSKIDFSREIQKNPKLLDYNKKEIIFKKIQIKKNFIIFEWKNEPICRNENTNLDCSIFLGKNYNKLSYNNFIKKLQDFVRISKETNKLEISSINNLKNKEIGKGKLFFTDVFKDKLIISKDISKEKMKSENIFTVSGLFKDLTWTNFFNENINNCNDYICNFVKYKNGKIYFFINYLSKNKDNGIFYYFNERFLEKEEDKEGNIIIYFNNEKIEYKKISADGSGIADLFSSDDKNVYLLKVKNIYRDDNINENSLVDIFLSPAQFSKISDRVKR